VIMAVSNSFVALVFVALVLIGIVYKTFKTEDEVDQACWLGVLLATSSFITLASLILISSFWIGDAEVAYEDGSLKVVGVIGMTICGALLLYGITALVYLRRILFWSKVVCGSCIFIVTSYFALEMFYLKPAATVTRQLAQEARK
jgi:hypothetical protein